MQDQPHKIEHCKIYNKVLTQTITSFLHRTTTSISLCSAADSRTEQVSFFLSFVSICSWQIRVWVPYGEHSSETSWTETGSWLLRLNHPVWRKKFVESLFRLMSGALSGQITGKKMQENVKFWFSFDVWKGKILFAKGRVWLLQLFKARNYIMEFLVPEWGRYIYFPLHQGSKHPLILYWSFQFESKQL